jgi:MYXO-CTERM domain-containing protein
MKFILSAGVMLLCSALAQAQSNHWTFTYTGFYDSEAAVFLADQQLNGFFEGTDANGDGVLDRGELTSLTIGATDYVACTSSTPYAHCGADSFAYSPSGGLSFSVGDYGGDPEGWSGGGHLITTGQMDYTYRYDPLSSSEHHLLWTDATRLAMSTNVSVMAAVPEAPHWAMLLAGVGGLGALRVARRRRAA